MAFVIQFRASSALLWSPLDMAYFIPQTIKNTNEMDIPTPKTKLIMKVTNALKLPNTVLVPPVSGKSIAVPAWATLKVT